MSYTKIPYSKRSQTHPTAVGRRLLSIMEAKKSNLCLSADLTDPAEILALVDRLGPTICLVKTHIDIISFSTPASVASFTASLQALAAHHNFLIFEDRKFADIGSTVQHQYRSGIYRIASWAHITNAHSVPGAGIIQGLRDVAREYPDHDRGLLMLGEMSSEGNLGGGEYLAKTVAMARRYKDFVTGFIAQGAIEGGEEEEEGEDFIVMSPGVGLARGGDGLGQRYNTPDDVVGVRGSDVIIVGRGIIKAQDPAEEAEKYRKAGWEAYERRLAS